MKSITPVQLSESINNGEKWTIIDVREDHERDICYFTEKHIPMGEIIARVSEIPQIGNVAIHCRSGKRSAAVIHTLEERFEFDNLHNLEGGILAWADQIDPSLEAY